MDQSWRFNDPGDFGWEFLHYRDFSDCVVKSSPLGGGRGGMTMTISWRKFWHGFTLSLSFPFSSSLCDFVWVLSLSLWTLDLNGGADKLSAESPHQSILGFIEVRSQCFWIIWPFARRRPWRFWGKETGEAPRTARRSGFERWMYSSNTKILLKFNRLLRRKTWNDVWPF